MVVTLADPPFISHADWAGRSVAIPDVLAELDEQRRGHALHGKAHGQARTANLVVIAQRDQEEEVAAKLRQLREHTPSRTIVLTVDPGKELDAWIQVDCDMAPGLDELCLCHDRIVLHASDEAIEHASSLVDQLLMPDLPLLLWLPGDEDVTEADGLLARADIVIIDARELELARAVERGLAALRHNPAVADLEWGRLAYWRRRIAAAFEDPAARVVAAGATTLEMVWRGTSQAGPMLLAGWAGARLGWTAGKLRERLKLDHDGTKPATGRLDEVAFRSSDGEVVLRRLPGDIDRHADVLAVTLRSQPDFVQGYAEALAELDKLLKDWPDA